MIGKRAFLFWNACFYVLAVWMTPHAIFMPEFPAGCEVKSSDEEWIRMVFPMISVTVKRSVKTFIHAYPPFENNGGRSPA